MDDLKQYGKGAIST